MRGNSLVRKRGSTSDGVCRVRAHPGAFVGRIGMTESQAATPAEHAAMRRALELAARGPVGVNPQVGAEREFVAR